MKYYWIEYTAYLSYENLLKYVKKIFANYGAGDGEYEGKILVPDSFDLNVFTDGFEKNLEINNFYTNGVIIGNPLIFDAANQKTHEFRKVYEKVYNSTPNWRSAYSYDAMLVLGVKSHSPVEFEEMMLQNEMVA